MGRRKVNLSQCKPGYHCLSCPYDDCVRPSSWRPLTTADEVRMLDRSGISGIWISIGKMNASERKKGRK